METKMQNTVKSTVNSLYYYVLAAAYVASLIVVFNTMASQIL
jgi:hypothetical protein